MTVICKQNQYEIKSGMSSSRDLQGSSIKQLWRIIILISLTSKSLILILNGQWRLIRIRSIQTSASRFVQMNQQDFHAPQHIRQVNLTQTAFLIKPSSGWIIEESAFLWNTSGSLGATVQSCGGEAEKEARKTNLQSLRWTMAAD